MLSAELRPMRRRILGGSLRTDDATLVRRTQAGDERAFAAIFERHHAPLLSYCRHMLSNRDDGEDALQQAFIKAHRALLGGTTPRDLRPWLYAIARNCCLSAIAARRPSAPLEDNTPALAGLSDEVHRREDLRELLDGLGRLPEDQRSALLLAELDDLSHQAIATVVGCPVSKVKALIYQARSALIADRDARETPCQEIREQLAVARGGELRRGPLRRHLNLCTGCRDFQLAVGAQRQSLATLLPVAPSAGLMAAILGHGSAHAAGAAGIGGVGAGATPAGGAAGTSVGVTSVGASATGGSGIATSGTAALGSAAGASAGTGAGTSIGTLVGSGVVTKLAVGGAVVALAAAGTVAVHRRPASASSSALARARLAAFAAHGVRVVGNGGAANGPYGVSVPIVGSGDALSVTPAGESSTALTYASGQGAPANVDPFTPLTSGEGSQGSTALTTAGPSNIALTTVSQQVKIGQGTTGEGSSSAQARRARAKLRREALRRRASRLREARRRASRLREARRRARLRKERREALRRRRHPAAAKTVKASKAATSPVAPAPVRTRHRHVLPSSTPLGTSGTSTASESSKSTKGQRHPPATSPGAVGTKTTGADPGTSTTSTGKGKASSGTGGEKPGSSTAAGKSGAGTEKAGSSSGRGKADSGAGGEKSSATAGERETGFGSGSGAGKSGDSESSTPSGAHPEGRGAGKQAGAGSTSRTGSSSEKSDTATHSGEANGAATTSGKGSTPLAKKHLLEEEQLPNL